MKVLIVSPSIDQTRGGIATVVQKLIASDHKQHGFTMEHLVTHAEGSVLKRLHYFMRSVIALVLKSDIKLMHIHVASKGSFYRKCILTFLGRMKGIPIIMHVHACDFDAFYSNSSSISRILIRRTFKSCYKVLVLSTYWQQYFDAHITKKNSNVEILFNGVDMSKELKRSNMQNGNASEFLFLGRLGQRKGVYDLLEAINTLVHELKYKSLLFYLAGDGDLDEVNKIIRQNGLSQNVRAVGWLDEKEKSVYLSKVRTVILPSYNEGLPMAILESMAYGKIIISTKVGGIPELVTHNENGFLVNAGNVQEIIQSILRVIVGHENLSQISKNNIAKIEANYNLEKLNHKLFQMYADAIIA